MTRVYREDSILKSWRTLLELLTTRRDRLDDALKLQLVCVLFRVLDNDRAVTKRCPISPPHAPPHPSSPSPLQQLFKEMSDTSDQISEIHDALSATDTGKHLQASEDLLQKLAILEGDLALQQERVFALDAQSQLYVERMHPEFRKVSARQQALSDFHSEATATARRRRQNLEAAVRLHEVGVHSHDRERPLQTFKATVDPPSSTPPPPLPSKQYYRDVDEADMWIKSRELAAKSQDFGRDLTSITSLRKKHHALRQEIRSFEKRYVQGPRSWAQTLSNWILIPFVRLPLRPAVTSPQFSLPDRNLLPRATLLPMPSSNAVRL